MKIRTRLDPVLNLCSGLSKIKASCLLKCYLLNFVHTNMSTMLAYLVRNLILPRYEKF
jgi:hypothetical protein